MKATSFYSQGLDRWCLRIEHNDGVDEVVLPTSILAEQIEDIINKIDTAELEDKYEQACVQRDEAVESLRAARVTHQVLVDRIDAAKRALKGTGE